MNVGDVMTRKVMAVRPETPLKEVARLLAGNRISGVPVVDDDGAVVGIVSEADFLLKGRGSSDDRGWLNWLLDDGQRVERERSKLAATTAGEAMSAPVVTIGPDATVRLAATSMLERGVNRLPVVEHGVLVGIVTRADLVRAFVRTDLELAGEIHSQISARAGWVELDDVKVSVEQGIARLGGRVHRRSVASLLERIAAEVDGILAVEDHLRWEVDDRHLPAAEETELSSASRPGGGGTPSL